MKDWYTRKFAKILSIERILWTLLIGTAVFFLFRYKTVQKLEQDSIVVTDRSGVQHKLSELTAGITLVHFYASWCGPCLKELPEIQKFMNTPLGKQINFVFITEDREDVANVYRERYGFTIYRVNKLKDANVYSIPVSYLLNENHEVVKSDLGEWEWDKNEFNEEIKTLIQ
jgi:thiol-disulfide isomerase/thioredoxin